MHCSVPSFGPIGQGKKTMITQEDKQNVITEFAVHEKDTGSPEVQIAILTRRIVHLTEHMIQR